MVHRVNRPPTWVLICMVLAAVALAAPAFAQDGMVKGTVRDEKGQAVDGAKVVIVLASGRTFETRSDKKGEFIQLGTPSGQYAISAEKDKLAALATPMRSTTRASSSGTPARSPRRRRRSQTRSPRTRTTPKRTISSAWRS